MEILSIELKNCYGIKKLEFDFDFSDMNGIVVYASNGTMKTSFAKTFLRISKGEEPEDLICHVPSSFDVKNELSEPIKSNEIFVIESFNDKIYENAIKFDNISSLLVKEDLKNEYDVIYKDIEECKKEFRNKMAPLLGLTKPKIDSTFIKDFEITEDEFLETLVSLEKEINGNPTFSVPEIKYNTLFNDKVINFLDQGEIIDFIDNYAKKYNELIETSDIFEKNIFTHNNAENVSKDLDKNGFFEAKHRISLKNGQLIKDKNELNDIILSEKERIISEDELKEWFDRIDSSLERNGELRNFKNLIGNNQFIIPLLSDIPTFKKKLWISALNTEKDVFFDLIRSYKDGKGEVEKIINKAKAEESDWKIVVDLFNSRFIVPFTLEVSNQEDVILKNKVPVVKFKHDDTPVGEYMEPKTLVSALSNGEKRALYLLNVIYELEIRKKNSQPTLIIADDIADSFDYQNKYAILEYLNDILDNDIFNLILLTHNFDFYRTVNHRLNLPRKNCYMVLKEDNEIKIVDGGYLRDVFSYWKSRINGNKRILIASIPFVRNLIDYIEGKDKDYLKLTSLLHLKSDTSSIKISDLKIIYKKIWNVDLDCEDDQIVFNIIFTEAENIVNDSTNEVNLENKIVLSMAIRLLAEKYMILKINDPEKIKAIKRNQTRELFNEFKKLDNDEFIVKNLEQVNLMTPENIHLNSFMYEPILDMSDLHLKKLYNQIKDINDAGTLLYYI